MAHTLTQQELSRFRDAFIKWDVTGDGTIRWPDLCKVMEEVGTAPSPELRSLCGRPDCEDERVEFDEFLNITVGPPWAATARARDEKDSLTEAIAEFDNGDGYVRLQDLMRIFQQHLEESGYNPTDGDLVDVYRQALDGYVFETTGGRTVPEVMWKVFQEEFADLRGGPKTKNADHEIAGLAAHFSTRFKLKCCEVLARLRFVHLGPARLFRRLCFQLGWQSVEVVALRDQAGADGESAGETARMMNITVVDLGGNPLMFDAVASTWSVHALQQHIEAAVGVPVHRQFLSLAGDDRLGRGLCPKDTLSQAQVADGSTIVLAAEGEVKLDYKKFFAQLMNVELGPSFFA